MAVVFSVPPYSFLQFTEPERACAWEDRPCLPVYALTDLQFQVFAEVDGDDKDAFESYHIGAGVTLDCEPGTIVTANYTGTWHQLTTGTYGNPDTWVGYFTYSTEGLFALYPVGQCFSIGIFRTDDAGVGLIECFGTCFTKISDVCYTSILAYRNGSNAFGFDYTSPVYNRVRLPFHCHSPIFSEEKTEYAKSDGSSVLLSYRLWKDYKIKTNYLFDYIHDRFGVGLSHSDIRITDTYSGLNQEAIVRTEKIELNWVESETPQFNVAQGSTVIRLAAARENVNSNCS